MNRKSKSELLRARPQCGQALSEGAVALIIIVGAAIVTLVFLCDVYLATSYKEKLAIITDQTADYLENASSSEDLSQLAQTKANQLIKDMGLPIKNPKIEVSSANQMIKVTIAGPCALLLAGLPVLPGSAVISDVAAIPLPSQQWAGSIQGDSLNSGHVYIPLQKNSSGLVGKIIGSLKCGPGAH